MDLRPRCVVHSMPAVLRLGTCPNLFSVGPQRCTVLFHRDANKADEENRQARQARRTGAVAEAPEEVVDATEEAVAEVETAVHQSLELEEGTPQFTSLTVGKIAAVSTQAAG